jgi:hypothetical protein
MAPPHPLITFSSALQAVAVPIRAVNAFASVYQYSSNRPNRVLVHHVCEYRDCSVMASPGMREKRSGFTWRQVPPRHRVHADHHRVPRLQPLPEARRLAKSWSDIARRLVSKQWRIDPRTWLRGGAVSASQTAG